MEAILEAPDLIRLAESSLPPRISTFRPELLSSLIEQIYSREAAGEHWQGFLRQLASLCGAADACFTANEDLPHASQPSGRQRRDGSLAAPIVLRSRHEADSCTCVYASYKFAERSKGFMLHGAEETGSPRDEALSLLKLLTPHMRQAVSLHRTLTCAKDCADAQAEALAMFDVAMLTVDPTGRVIEGTGAAQSLLHHGLTLKNGMLLAHEPAENSSLQRLLLSALGQSRAGSAKQSLGGAITITRMAPLESLQVVVTPIQTYAGGEGAAGFHAALVFLCDPQRQPSSRLRTLATLYGLSPTELRLTGYLLDGMKPKGAAAAMRMTDNTVRFHLKQIFRKTGVNSQTALLRLILGLPGAGTAESARQVCGGVRTFSSIEN